MLDTSDRYLSSHMRQHNAAEGCPKSTAEKGNFNSGASLGYEKVNDEAPLGVGLFLSTFHLTVSSGWCTLDVFLFSTQYYELCDEKVCSLSPKQNLQSSSHA